MSKASGRISLRPAGISFGMALLVAVPAPVQATTIPNINGAVFSISGGGTAFNCTNPLQNGPISTPPNTTFTVISQSGGTFNASEVSSSVSFFDNYSGSIDANGNVSGNSSGGISGVASDSGTFSGQININTGMLSIVENGLRTFNNGDTCQFTLTRTGTLISGPVEGDAIVDPSRTSGSVITAPKLFSSEINTLVTDLSGRIREAMHGVGFGFRTTGNGLAVGHASGVNAGDLTSLTNLGYWLSYSHAEFDNDFAPLAYDGSRNNVLGGVDFSPHEGFLAGVAFGYEFTDIDTEFNGGELENDGFTIAPYFGALINNVLSIDGSIGYSGIENDQFRLDPVSGSTISSDPDTDRWFMHLNLNGVIQHDRWIFDGRLGTLWARSETERFIESNGTQVAETRNKLFQLSIGGNIAYQYLNEFGSFEPFAGVVYERDFSLTEVRLATGKQPANDNDDFLVSAGLRYFATDSISANFEWNKRVGREDFDEDIYTFTLRVDY